MDQLLPAATTVFDLVALAAALSLGLYIVTRSPRSRVSWLAALTLSCVALFFFHNALAINMPASGLLPWLQPTMLLVPALWFHLSIELVQERAQQQGRAWTTGAAARRLAVVLAYAAGVALLLLSVFWLDGRVAPITSAGLHAAERASDPLYPFTTAYVVLLASLSLANLWRGYRRDSSEVRRRQFRPLFIATVLAALGGVYVTVGIGLGIDLPELPRDLAFGVAVALLGFAVARHNALVEGRVIEADLLYVFLAVGSLTAVAVLLAELLYSAGHVFSFVTLVLVMAVTICVLMLYDGVRTALDRLFYRDQFRQLRANLRSLANEAGAGQPLPDQLQAVLAWLCATVSVEQGWIALAKNGEFVVQASQGAAPIGQTIARSYVLCDEMEELAPQPRHTSGAAAGPEILAGMALLAPIAAGGSQMGALALGPKVTQQPYDDEDLMLLLVSILFAVVGGLAWGVLVDRIGPKRTLNIVLLLWMATLSAIVLIAVFDLSKWLFWAVATVTGVALGGVWAADRPYMLRLAPPRFVGEFYGLYAMVGRFASIIGPFLWGYITDTLGLGRPAAVASLLVFIVIAFFILQGVDDRPREWPAELL